MHESLRPHLLRRLKRDVLRNLPRKKELIVRVHLTQRQREIYRLVLTRNYEALQELDRNKRGQSKVSVKSLCSVLTYLRLCCDHPLLLSPRYNPRLTANALGIADPDG